MKKSKIVISNAAAAPMGKSAGKIGALEALRKWIPCEEFCELYRLPKTRPPRAKAAKYPTSKATAARKCCERLAAKKLIQVRRIDGRLYVSRESVIAFGEKA